MNTTGEQRGDTAAAAGPRTHGAMSIRRVGDTSQLTFPTSPAGSRLRKLIGALLKVEAVAAAISDTGVRLERKSERVAGERAGRLVIPAGFEPTVVQTLATVGVPYKLTGERKTVVPVAVWVDGVDRVLLGAVGEHERLVARVGEDVDVAAQVTLVCRAFPGLRTVVLAKRIKDVRRVVHLLGRSGIDASSFTCADRDGRFFGRVAVATYRHAGDERVGLWDADLLVVRDVADALGEDGRRTVEYAHGDHPTAPRVLGFARAGFRPSLNQYRWMTRYFGTDEVVVPAPGAVDRRVEYVFLRLGGVNARTRRAESAAGVGAVKSAGVWHNPVRNRLVARLACGLRDGDAAAVAGRFGKLAGHHVVGTPASVLVVAENATHADVLLRGGLAGWQTVGGGWGSVAPETLNRSGEFEKPPSLVGTFDALGRMNVAGFDVVIRADAGTGGLPLAPAALHTADAAAEPLLLVDFADVCQPVLRDFAKRRRATYAAQGWVAADGSGLPTGLVRFLARHPHGKRLQRDIEKMARELGG